MDDFGDEAHTFKDLSLTDLHDGKFQVGSGPEQEPDAQAEASAGDEKGKKKRGKEARAGKRAVARAARRQLSRRMQKVLAPPRNNQHRHA